MSNATVSSSGKSQSGTLHSLGGSGFDDYYGNLIALFSGDPEAADAVIEEFKSVLTPVASFAAASAAINHGFPGSTAQNEPRQGAGAPPGAATVCPTHGQPAVWREGGVSQSSGKPYQGFWKCPVTSESISAFGGKGLKPSCPERKN